MKGTILAVIATFAMMAAAYRFSRLRRLHVGIMAFVMVFDVLFPIYLYAVNDWYKQLIQEGQIFSFSPWMHFMLIIVLYALYFMQIQAGVRLLRGEESIRTVHRQQGRGIILARLLAFVTGAMLIVR